MANFNIQPLLQQIQGALQNYQDYQAQKVNTLPQQILGVLNTEGFQNMLNPTVRSALTSGRYVQQKASETANRMLNAYNTMYNSTLPYLYRGSDISTMMQPYLLELQAQLAEQAAQNNYERNLAMQYPWGRGGMHYVGSVLNPVGVGTVANPDELNNTPLAAHTKADANRRAQTEMGQSKQGLERDDFSWYADQARKATGYRSPTKQMYPNTPTFQTATSNWGLSDETKQAPVSNTSSNTTQTQPAAAPTSTGNPALDQLLKNPAVLQAFRAIMAGGMK